MKAAAPNNDRDWKGLLLGSTLIFVFTILVYWPAIRAGFIWDDDDMLTQNPLVQSAHGLAAMWNPWAKDNFFDFIPLTLTSFWLEWRLWGLDALGYHVTNVLLHATTAILFWRALNYLKIPGTWLIGLIFAIHPVNVESVAWITERKNTLALIFYALALLWYLRFESGRERKWYRLALGAFVFGLLSKGAIVMLPFVLLGCAWWLRGEITKKDFRNTLPFFLTALVFSALTIWFQYSRSISTDADVVQTNNFAAKLSVAGMASVFYFLKAVFPHNLMFVYRWENPNPHHWIVYLASLFVVLCLALFWFYRKRWGRPFLFGVGYFVVTLFPVLGFFKIYFQKYSFVADHWQYPSIIGLIALIVGGAAYLVQRLVCHLNPNPAPDLSHSRPAKEKKAKAKTPWKIKALTAIIALAALSAVGWLGRSTWRQCGIYKNEETLWRDEISKNQRCWLAQHNLASLLLQQWDREESFKSADQRNDEKLFQASVHDQTALAFRPNHAGAHYNLATIAMRQGRIEEAVPHLRETIKLEPDNLMAINTLGWILAANENPKLRNGAEAMRLATASVELTEGKDPKSLQLLACALAETGNFPAAMETAQKALKLATAMKQLDTTRELEIQLKLFEAGRAYRER